MLEETFKAKMERNGCFTVPKKIRWRHKLGPGLILRVKVRVFDSYWRSEAFYGRLYRDGRIFVPVLIRELLKLKPHQVVSVKIEVPKDSMRSGL